MPSPIALDVSTDDRLFAGIIAIAHRSAIRFVDDQSAEDVAQDVAIEFLDLLACGALTREPRSLEAFTTRRAKSRARNWLRRQAHREARQWEWLRDHAERDRAWMRPDVMVGEAELAGVERRTIEGMPPMRQRVFTMVRAGDRTYEQIARTLGVTQATVRYHVSEAQRQFRRELGAYGVNRPPTSRQVLTRAGRTARTPGKRSPEDRPWMLITLALAARSPPAIHPEFQEEPMQTRQGSMLQSLRNVESFLDKHADVLGTVVQSGTRQKLADAIAALATHVSGQTGSNLASRGATQKHYTLRQVLIRRHMAPVARIAAADLPHTPELMPLRMPAQNLPAEKLAAAAYGMAKAATPFTDVFTAAGLPADFVQQLTGAADAMTGAIDERALERNSQRGATTGLREKLAAGRKIVHVLDAFVTDALANDPALLSSWHGAKRVRIIPPTPVAPSTTPALPVPATPSSPAPAIPTP